MNVYTVMAHACDTGEVLPVPEGCTFITLATCGNMTNTADIAIIKFRRDFSANEPRLRDPIRNITWLKEQYGSGVNIHCNHRGFDNTYSNIEYEYPFGTCVGIACDPSYVQEHNRRDIEGCICKSTSTGLYALGTNISTDFVDISTLQDLKEIFRNAVIPTNDSIDSSIRVILGTNELQPTDYTTMKEISMSSMEFNRQSQFFMRHPGIYYHITCRSSCDGTPTSLSLRRHHSNMRNYLLTPDIVTEVMKMDPSYKTLLYMVKRAKLNEKDKTNIADMVMTDIEAHNGEETPTITELGNLLSLSGGKTKKKRKKSTRTRVNSFVRKRRFV